MERLRRTQRGTVPIWRNGLQYAAVFIAKGRAAGQGPPLRVRLPAGYILMKVLPLALQIAHWSGAES